MKRWHKVLMAVLILVIAAVAATICVYRYYAKDKIEKTLEMAQVILRDEKVRREVEGFVDEMLEAGEIDESQLEGYIEYKEALEAEATPSPSATTSQKSPLVTPAPVVTPVPTSKPKTLIERVQAEMTAEEFAFAMSMYGKIDVNYCVSNYVTNKAAVKKHIKSRLTSSEISRSLKIYSKYSYVLR